jgi:hypothetical protein
VAGFPTRAIAGKYSDMARKSKYGHLKTPAIEMFKQGLTPQDFLREHPDVATSTVYDWYNAFRNGFGMDGESLGRGAIANPESPRLLHIVPSDEDDDESWRQSDIAWAKRQIRKHILRPNKDSAVAVQALNAYLRAIQIERAIADDSDGSELTDETRVARVAELLDAARARRVGQVAQ